MTRQQRRAAERAYRKYAKAVDRDLIARIRAEKRGRMFVPDGHRYIRV